MERATMRKWARAIVGTGAIVALNATGSATAAEPTPTAQASKADESKDDVAPRLVAAHKLSRAGLANIHPKSGGFAKDILSFGGSDTGLHRVQMLAWTVILWAIFVIEAYRTLAMPEFSAELLGLMGISSGTYVGFKAVTQ